MVTRWRNWSGTVRSAAARTARPAGLEDVVEAVRAARRDGLRIKAVGAGHSFSGAAVTDGLALHTDGLTGIERADPATGLVTVRSGTRLRDLNLALADLGLALPTLGDVDVQTVAGAVSTGTHGSGAALPGLASLVREAELVTAAGDLVSAGAGREPQLLEAARLGLGALGVVTSVTLQCGPAFLLHAQEGPMPLAEVLERLDELADGNDHVDVFWWPHTRAASTRRFNRLPEGAEPAPLHRVREWVDDRLVANTVFEAVTTLGRAVPGVVPLANRMAPTVQASRTYADASHRVLVSPWLVRFAASEWALPRAAVRQVLHELQSVVAGLDGPVAFPVQVRFAAADDVWLSPAHDRATAYVAVRQAAGMPRRRWFQEAQAVAVAAGGRPHWGTLHGLDAAALRPHYPRFDDFLAVRRRLDPDGAFANPYLDRVLGPVGPSRGGHP